MQGHQMGNGMAWLVARAQELSPPDGRNAVFQHARNQSTAMLINEFRFAAAKSIRTSTIILASFNAVAACATALGILYDNYTTKKRNDRNFKIRGIVFNYVQAAEVYPLVLSIGIAIQGTGFAILQANGLSSLLTRGCTLVAQAMLPLVFIAPYIQLVFGVEVTLRALRRKPLPPRPKWTVTICLVIIALFLLANFLVADFMRSPDFCFASLFWYVAKYAAGCFALLTGISAVLFIGTIIIVFRLSRSTKIDPSERVAASRMVYYLGLAIVTNVLMIPFFFDLAFLDQSDPSNQALTMSMVASVVANVSGLLTGGLHLFLRSNTISTIGRKHMSNKKDRPKSMKSLISRPGSRTRDDDDHDDDREQHGGKEGKDEGGAGAAVLRRMLSDASLISWTEKEYDKLSNRRRSSTYSGPDVPNPLRSNTTYSAETVRAPEPAQLARPATGNSVKQSYSLFPAPPSAAVNSKAESTKSFTLLPATTYSPQTNIKSGFDFGLKPPPAMNNISVKHRRDSSMVSSATVQIGLRISNVADMPREPPQTLDAQVYSLDCPDEKSKLEAKRPSPLAAIENASTTDVSSIYSEEYDDLPPLRDPSRDVKTKTLPPVPPVQPSSPQRAPVLSPSVYSQLSPTKSKITSPKGVGFAATISRPSTAARSPPPFRSGSSASRRQPASSGGEWI